MKLPLAERCKFNTSSPAYLKVSVDDAPSSPLPSPFTRDGVPGGADPFLLKIQLLLKFGGFKTAVGQTVAFLHASPAARNSAS